MHSTLSAEVTPDRLPSLLNISPHSLDEIVASPKRYYRPFRTIIKGKPRLLSPSSGPLKIAQRNFLKVLYNQTHWLSCVHGGIPHRSIITNARPHCGQYLVVTYDIASFFPSTTREMVYGRFCSIGFNRESAEILTSLVILDGSLPLGAPTSTAVANLVFRPSDIALVKLARRHRLIYTRYVDDIAISGSKDFRDLSQAIRGNIEKVGYKVNERKIRYQFRQQRQVITGLVVNGVLSPTRPFISETKRLIRRCQSEGPGVVADQHGLFVRAFRDMLLGRVLFVRSVNRKKGRELRRLLVAVNWRADDQRKSS